MVIYGWPYRSRKDALKCTDTRNARATPDGMG
jgi:hypothetical protein